MTSPFGYDYYLSLATLRDADNDTLVDAYLAGMAPVAGMLSETLRNLTELNETLKASRETHLHARRALAHARGARRVARFLVSSLTLRRVLKHVGVADLAPIGCQKKSRKKVGNKCAI